MAIDGTYEGIIKSPLGKNEVTLVFTTDGSVLTGTVGTKKGTTEIREGSVEENSFKFVMTMKTPMGQNDATVEGTVDGDALTGNVTTPLGTVPLTGQRA